MGPLPQNDSLRDPPALCEVPKDHERADSTPDSAQERVDQEDARPPVSPEKVESKIMLPVLGAE